MANEATITVSLTMAKNNTKYASKQTQHQVDVTGQFGPAPGTVLCGTAATGTEIDLSAFTTPGMVEFFNLDTSNYIEVGIYDGADFHPMIELGPGENYVMKLSRNVLFGDSGTAVVNQLRGRANSASAALFVGAFER